MMANTTTPAAAATYASSSLYVGDLAPEVSEGKLFDIFNAVGPVASIRVCRDAMLKRSLGYAYVNFHAQADAERALETINYTAIMGRPCRIMWSQRDPSLRKSGVGNIIVKSLHPDVHHKELQDTFSLFGNILSCKVALDAEGKSKGYGYVQFQTDEAAKAAVDRMDEIEIMGTKVSIEKFQKKTAPQRAAKWTNLFLKNVPTHLTEADLTTMFAEHGKVQSLKLMVYSEEEVAKDAASGKSHDLKAGGSKGFGFVNFEEHEAAAAAAEALNGKWLPDPDSAARREAAKAKAEEDKKAAVAAAVAAAKAAGGDEAKAGEEAAAKADAVAASKAAAAGDNGEGVPTRELFVGRAQKKEERLRELKKKFQLEREKTAQSFMGVNLYVKNLDDQLDEKSLDAAFKPYGTITSSRIMRHPDGTSKGFGFVCYSSPEEATAASNDMNGKVLGGKPIFVALAQRREQRREMLSQTLARVPAGAMPMGGGPRGPMPGQMYGAVPMMYQAMGGRGGQQQGGPYGMPAMMMGGKGMPRGGPMPYGQQRGPYPMQGGYPGGMPNQMMGPNNGQQPRQRRNNNQQQRGGGAQGKGGQQMRQGAPQGQGQVSQFLFPSLVVYFESVWLSGKDPMLLIEFMCCAMIEDTIPSTQ
jgi:polyadenylate-binding protein